MDHDPSTCAICHEPLVVELDQDSEDGHDLVASSSTAEQHGNTVPDDVSVSCGHHFHWDCLMECDNYEISTCPVCLNVIGNGEQVLVDYRNEGGLQQQLDIFPILREEAYLRTYPEERKCRAFLEFCKEGDHLAIAELLLSCDEDDDEQEMQAGPKKTADDILRYQDPIGGMQSGLHAAVANGSREVAWTLLLLASNFPKSDFPAFVFQEAAALGIMRPDPLEGEDIRGLLDSHGRTAEDLAKEAGVIWHGWTGNGRLSLN